MEQFVNIFNLANSIGIVFLQLFIFYVIFLLIFKKGNLFLLWLNKNTFFLLFFITLCATIFSLIYSLIIGYPPCILCIIQRYFIYPQVLLFGLFLINPIKNKIKENWIITISLVLTILGGIVSLYHNWLDFGGGSLGICGEGDTISCTKRFVFEFGYITIPMMTLTIFITMFILLLNQKIQNKSF